MTPPATSPIRDNNFNLLRLVLATLVLLSHSFEIIDGGPRRELLTRFFGTATFGGLAVYGFFLLSGFLIVQSWYHGPNLLDFFKKRVLRIYPAFVVASLVSIYVVGPLGYAGGGYLSQVSEKEVAVNMLFLQVPVTPPVFQGQPYPIVNGAMWTIAYEFRCYMLVALLGTLGLVRRRGLWLAVSACLLALSLVPESVARFAPRGLDYWIGDPAWMVRFLPCFTAGGCFFLFRDRIRYKANWAWLAGILLFSCLFRATTAQFGLVVFGGYLLFGFAFARVPLLARFRAFPDISYGTYLYGWPTQKLILWYLPAVSPWLLFALSCVGSWACGWLSWHLVEKPFLRLKRKPVKAAPAPGG